MPQSQRGEEVYAYGSFETFIYHESEDLVLTHSKKKLPLAFSAFLFTVVVRDERKIIGEMSHCSLASRISLKSYIIALTDKLRLLPAIISAVSGEIK